MVPRLKLAPDKLLLGYDLAGTLVFAIEGTMAAVAARLDLLGLLVLAFVTALGGGMMRDVLIGAAPPNSIRDWRYPATALTGGALVFMFHSSVAEVPPAVLVGLDALGLALFGVAGALKALDFGIHPFIAVLMGGLTGVGGGVIRDILLSEVPHVLQSDIYGAAAMAGAAVMVIGLQFRRGRLPMAFLGGTVCFVLRMVSYTEHWNLPRVLGR